MDTARAGGGDPRISLSGTGFRPVDPPSGGEEGNAVQDPPEEAVNQDTAGGEHSRRIPAAGGQPRARLGGANRHSREKTPRPLRNEEKSPAWEEISRRPEIGVALPLRARACGFTVGERDCPLTQVCLHSAVAQLPARGVPHLENARRDASFLVFPFEILP